jgi:hypothetical protein
MARAIHNSPVQPGDQVSILSNLVSVGGPIGSQAACVLQPQSPIPSLIPPVINALGSDSYGSSGQGQCLSYDGYQIYGTVGEQCTTPGTVLSIVSGVGSISILKVLLRSGNTVLVPSGSCTCANNMGNGPSAQ